GAPTSTTATEDNGSSSSGAGSSSTSARTRTTTTSDHVEEAIGSATGTSGVGAESVVDQGVVASSSMTATDGQEAGIVDDHAVFEDDITASTSIITAVQTPGGAREQSASSVDRPGSSFRQRHYVVPPLALPSRDDASANDARVAHHGDESANPVENSSMDVDFPIAAAQSTTPDVGILEPGEAIRTRSTTTRRSSSKFSIATPRPQKFSIATPEPSPRPGTEYFLLKSPRGGVGGQAEIIETGLLEELEEAEAASGVVEQEHQRYVQVQHDEEKVATPDHDPAAFSTGITPDVDAPAVAVNALLEEGTHESARAEVKALDSEKGQQLQYASLVVQEDALALLRSLERRVVTIHDHDMDERDLPSQASSRTPLLYSSNKQDGKELTNMAVDHLEDANEARSGRIEKDFDRSEADANRA
ncbi:unnamed protein product, partial [Amoebophrya sp. A25]